MPITVTVTAGVLDKAAEASSSRVSRRRFSPGTSSSEMRS